MLLSLLVMLLVVLANLTVSAPVKTKPASPEEASSASKHRQILRPTIYRPSMKPMAESVRSRFYRKTRFDENGRELTRDEWESMFEKDPALEAKYYRRVKDERAVQTRRYRLRKAMKQDPENPKHLKLAREQGFSIEDLQPGGQDKSAEAVKKRNLIRSALGHLREDIQLIGTPAQKRKPYKPGTYANQFTVGKPKRDSNGNVEGSMEQSVEDQLLDELARFKAALRENPYDSHLVAWRDKIHVLMKSSLGLFYPLSLPTPPRAASGASSSSRSIDASSKNIVSHDAPSTPSRAEQQSKKVAPPSIEELRALPEQKKGQYIQSLFE